MAGLHRISLDLHETEWTGWTAQLPRECVAMTMLLNLVTHGRFQMARNGGGRRSGRFQSPQHLKNGQDRQKSRV
jgi:hypothetical protein